MENYEQLKQVRKRIVCDIPAENCKRNVFSRVEYYTKNVFNLPVLNDPAVPIGNIYVPGHTPNQLDKSVK